MANTILTPTQVTRAALAVLHQKCNFVGSINRQYDKSFAVEGAKVGSQLKVRLPNQYVIRRGAALVAQDTTEQSTLLTVTNQTGVDLNFTSADLTLSIQDFTKRIIMPAISVLAANIEADAFSMINDVYNCVNNIGSAAALSKLLLARKALVDNLSPDDRRVINLNTQDNVDIVTDTKGLFNPTTELAKQYKKGFVGTTAGFGDVYENTIIPTHTTGTCASSTGYTVNGAGQTGSAIAVQTGTNTFLAGDIITLPGVNRCHPETKLDTGIAQQFVITANSGASATSLSISPAIVLSGGTQNVVASPTNGGAVTKVGGASAIYKPTLAYHEDAFTIAFADLIMPNNLHFSSRQVMDGISMRIVQQYDINNDKFPCRVDVLYGYKTLRAQTACQLLSN